MMGLHNGENRAAYVEPTAAERAVIDWIITTMHDEIARVEATVLSAFTAALAAARPSNKWRVLAAFMYRPGFAERWLRYKLEGRPNKEICLLEGASRSP
jgi:hypothetical protein